MNFVRLIVVFVAVALAGGIFGSIVGGLFGVGAGGPVAIYGGSTEYTTTPEGDTEVRDATVRGVEGGIGKPGETRTGTRGAAVGGAFGLLIGAVLGLGLGLLDQLVLFFREATAKKDGDPSGSV